MGVSDKPRSGWRCAPALAFLLLANMVVAVQLDRSAAVAAPTLVAADPALDEGTSLRAARTTGERVEVLAARTETQQIFAEPSGQLTLVQHAVPVRVHRDGAWRPIDTTLRHRANGTVSPAAITVDLTLSDGGSTPLVTLAAKQHRLSLSWPDHLPEPVLAGDTATYPEVLPGVDLAVTATVDGYRQRLIVKDRAAAANPALRRITFRTQATGLTLRSAPDGSVTALGPNSESVFVAGAPTMWDTPATTARTDPDESDDTSAARQRPIQLEIQPNELTIVPDASLLDDPNAEFPIVIDPDFGSGAAAWLHLNLKAPNQNGWGWDQSTGAKVGRAWGDTPVYRSFFQFNLNSIGGSVVSAAYFRILMDHSASCGPTPAELWHTGGIWNGTTWGNTGNGHWYSWLDVKSGNANEAGGCGNGSDQPDFQLEYSGGLTGLMQTAANDHWGQVTLGIKAPNESDQQQWKKFFQSSATVQVTYNHRPSLPAELSTVPPTPCGTATAPTPLNTPTPTFTTRVTDPNLNAIKARLQIREGSTARYDVTSPSVGSGSVLSWAAPPAGTLPDNQPTRTFSYQASSTDELGLGTDWSTACYFTVDRQIPGTPAVESADFPDGEPVRSVGQVGTLRLSPGVGPTGQPDADIAGYRYGFQQDRLTGWAPADGTGQATIPMVLWQTNRTLYIQAVDKAGNPSVNETPCICTAWDLRTNPSSATPAHETADLNGDDRGDIAALLDMGNGRTAVWNAVTRSDGGLYAPYIGWDSGVNGGFAGYRTKSAQGDFDGDGLADIAVFREDPDRRLRLFLLRSDSHRYDADPAPEWEGPLNSHEWTLNLVQLGVTDVDNDSRADLLVLVPPTANQFNLHVFKGGSAGLAAPQHWYNHPEGLAQASRIRLVTGDFNGDGFGDAGYFYNYDNSQTKLWLHYSNGTQAFSTAVQVWDSGVNNWEWSRITPAVGDYNGDGRDDILAMYSYDLNGNVGWTRFWMFPGMPTNAATTATMWWDSGAWNTFHTGHARLSAGDFNGDGRSDLAAFYETTSPTAKIHIFHTKADATGFQSPNLSAPPWTGAIGAVNSTFQPESNRSYWLRARHSGKCLQLRGGSGASGTVIEQATCATGQDRQLFRFEPVGNGTYYQLRPLTGGLCTSVNGATHGDTESILNQTCQTGAGNQQWRFEYLAGTSLDTIIRPRAAHSDKCFGANAASTTDGAYMVQSSCWSIHQEYMVQIRS
jgi:hypothetical protein